MTQDGQRGKKSVMSKSAIHRPPARYWPLKSGRYEVKPALQRFGTEFGNGSADHEVFQIDTQFELYRRTKMEARAVAMESHVLRQDYAESVAEAVNCFVAHRLVAEHSSWFELRCSEDRRILTCHLTGENLVFDLNWRLIDSVVSDLVHPGYISGFDALACQIQEDLAVTCLEADHNWLSALHVCLPSHWAPNLKIGQSFAQVHKPVPDMEPTTNRQHQFVDQMIGAVQGLVRFVWGVQRDGRLNGYPDGSLESGSGGACVRIERQTIWGLPEVNAALFTIRPYLVDLESVCRDPLRSTSLAEAVKDMSLKALQYKGLELWKAELLQKLGG